MGNDTQFLQVSQGGRQDSYNILIYHFMVRDRMLVVLVEIAPMGFPQAKGMEPPAALLLGISFAQRFQPGIALGKLVQSHLFYPAQIHASRP